jgi:acylphosphatase
MIHVDLTIHGKVQGVFFRAEAKKHADLLGLGGFIRNDDEGFVEVELEGEASLIDRFIAWCHEGPPLAKVGSIEIAKSEGLKSFSDFTIRK